MCVDYVTPKKKAINAFLKSLGRRKTFVAYKVLRSDGTPSIFGIYYRKPKYGPGYHYATNMDGERISNKYPYTENNSAGIHVYRTLQEAKIMRGFFRTIIEVTCHRDDILCVGDTQIALSKIYISKKQWEKFTCK